MKFYCNSNFSIIVSDWGVNYKCPSFMLATGFFQGDGVRFQISCDDGKMLLKMKHLLTSVIGKRGDNRIRF